MYKADRGFKGKVGFAIAVSGKGGVERGGVVKLKFKPKQISFLTILTELFTKHGVF